MTHAHEARWQMHQRVTCPEGRPIYARRKVIVEPVFGQINQARGFRRFFLRGLAKVAAEWGIVCLCHNLLKLYRATAAHQPSPAERVRCFDPSQELPDASARNGAR